MNLHDQVFKEMIRAFFPGFLRLFFPEAARDLDFTTLEFLDKEQFTDIPKGRQRTVDLLARVETLAGVPELILIHVEIQATRPADFGERMHEYYMLLRLRYGMPVWPVVAFLLPGVGGMGWETWRESLYGQEIVVFRYGRVGLRDLPAAEYLRAAEPLAYALAALMRPSAEGRARLKADCLERVARSGVDEARQSLLHFVVESYLDLTPDELSEYEQLTLQPEYKEMEQLRTPQDVYRLLGLEQGRDEGLKQGLLEGSLAGARKITRLLIERKFGPLSESALQRFQSLDEDALDQLAIDLLQANSLQELGLTQD